MITFSIIKKSQLEGHLRLDAEYYRPEYLELEKKLGNQPTLKDLAKDIICGPFGSAILNNDYMESGIPLLRVNNLNNDFIEAKDLIFIKDALSEKLKRYLVSDGDIVVSQRGTIAMFSMVTDDYNKYCISANLISILDSNKINFQYLIAYLNSKYGNSQLLRRVSGQVQPKITTDDVKGILVYLPDNNFQNSISNLVKDAKRTLDLSFSLYSQAQKILLEELGLNDFEARSKLFSIVNLSEVTDNNRIDAEYYQPKYEELVSKIKESGSKKLGDLVILKKGFEPGSEAYQEEGKIFIRVSSLSKDGLEDKDQKYLSEDLYKELKDNYQPKVGEILLTKDATPGIACVVSKPVEGIISGGILRLKLKDEKIDNEYLALCLNSLIGAWQAERDAGGSIIAHWKPDQIKEILIPILSAKKQKEIADLVRQSHEARQKSKALLEEAKTKVEELIENNAK